MNTAILTFLVNHSGSVDYLIHIGLFGLLCTSILGYGATYPILRHVTTRVWVTLACTWALVYAVVLTIGQYMVWAQSGVTRGLLSTPLADDTPRMLLHAPVFPFVDGAHGYYIFYAYTHFWMPVMLAVVSAVLVYGLFTFLQKRKPDAVADEEVLLAAGIAFLVGWPNMLIFVTLAFACAVVHTGLGHIHHGSGARTRMVVAILLAGLITLILGVYLGARVGIGAMVV